jgi:hypothetical protein
VTQSKFRPVGACPSTKLVLSRRAFLGVSAAVPATLVLDGTAWPAASPGPPYDLRFVEDSQGLSVIDARDQVWRLHRLAFGPSTTFTLRTLKSGNRKGYELQIGNLRFGTLTGRDHWIVFQRVGDEGDGWKVRLRSNLWSGPQGEIISEDVSLAQLTQPPAMQSAVWFRFPPASFAALRALENAVEGHIKASGVITFTFCADCAWRFKPLRSGCLTVVPYGMQLDSLTLAWCEPVISPNKEQADLPKQLTALADIDRDTELSLTSQTKPQHSSASKPQDASALAVAQPIFCASGLTRPGDHRLLYKGDSSFRLALNYKSADKKATLSYIYLRRNWNPADKNLPGIAEMTASRPDSGQAAAGEGQWSFTAFSGSDTKLGELAVQDAFLRVRRRADGGLDHEFAGFAAALAPKTEPGRRCCPDPKPAGTSAPLAPKAETVRGFLPNTPIGALEIESWPPGERAAYQNRTVFKARYFGHGTAVGQVGVLGKCSVPLRLFACPLSLDGADFSQLTFNAEALLAVWCPKDAVSGTLTGLQSYLWLGKHTDIGSRPVLKLDLSRSRLVATRSHDLLEVAFLFADLWLEIGNGKAKIVPAAASYRVLKRQVLPPSATIVDSIDVPEDLLDTRPVLVVEFPPQHVFEETIFKTGATDLPDVALLKDQKPADNFTVKLPGEEKETSFSTHSVELMGSLATYHRDDRKLIRKELASRKIAQEGDGLFKLLHDRLQTECRGTECQKIDDQYVYIGPYGMDPDVRARARSLMAQIVSEQQDRFSRKVRVALSNGLYSDSFTERLIDRANQLAYGLNNPDSYKESDTSLLAKLVRALRSLWREQNGTAIVPPAGPAEAVLREQAIASLLPLYALFRDYYREQMVRAWMKSLENKQASEWQLTSDAPEEIEFFSANNRNWAPKLVQITMLGRQLDVAALYDKALTADPAIAAVMRARLAKPSRLAFRLNPKPGKAICFNLDALLDWQTHELAVAPRARVITPFDQEGRPPALSDSQSSQDDLDAGFPELGQKSASDKPPTAPQKAGGGTTESPSAKPSQKLIDKGDHALVGAVEDVSMLRSLSFRFGPMVTAQQRLTDVEASLRAPDSLETAIEIPARLVLSPSQTAQWRIPWTPLTCGPFPPSRLGPIPLWSVELVTQPTDPGVRAIYSPDLRAGFVRQKLELAASNAARSQKNTPLVTPVSGPPPRGMRAPWTLGLEDGGPAPTKSEDLATKLGIEIHPSEADENLPPLIRYLRRREDEKKNYHQSAFFRSSLDAYDRHEIVVLSSAYGLPVSGKRDAMGKLLPLNLSSQAEPPLVLQPIDLAPGSALYRPRSLKIQELRLSALGGTLRHDTDFVPPTSAEHLVYGDLYDSLTVERWQHWVVLGRDVFAEVVYKGFLFPIGHRASLVKQTERVFLRATPDGSIRAYLEQRIFIRIGQPEKAFPALGQPNHGRQFPSRSVLLLTTVTPDLVDPSQDDGKQTDQSSTTPVTPTSAGRLLADFPGLVFWPRTAPYSGAEVRFEALMEGSFVKLPLVFVDNAAAQNADTLSALTDYYNGPAIPVPAASSAVPVVDPHLHLRTVDFNQQATRYCEEIKPASSTHRTLYWNLKASGGAEPAANTGKPDNIVFHNSALDGADQPSFYPAIEIACIRLDQVERMTAGKPAVAIAQYDDDYLTSGFPSKKSTQEARENAIQPPVNGVDGDADAPQNAEDGPNPLEIYLKITNAVSFAMGAAGDRSGGVYRPGADVVALSRIRGPIGGSREAFKASAYTGTGNQSYINYFTSSQTVLDTKLLGVLSLKDVVSFCQHLRPATEGLPQLQEILHYGPAAEGATDKILRTSLVQPLTQVMAELDKQWNRVDQQLAGETDNQILKVSLSDIFPELNRARNDFAAALGTTQSLNGVEFFASLADVYETGRRLENALDQAATHIPERSFLAVANALPTFLQVNFDLKSVEKALIDPVCQQIGKQVNCSTGTVSIESFTNGLADLILEDPLSTQRFFPGAGSLTPPGLSTAQFKQRLSEQLQLVSGNLASIAAQQFANALQGEPGIGSLAGFWTTTMLPLFEMSSAVHQAAISSNDPKLWADAALTIFSRLWPLPADLRCSESNFRECINKLLERMGKLTSEARQLPKTSIRFQSHDDSIELPPWCEPVPTSFFSARPKPNALCSFAKAAQDTLASIGNHFTTVKDDPGKAFLVNAANASLAAQQQTLQMAELLPKPGNSSYTSDIAKIRPEYLTSLFKAFQDLMGAVTNALAVMLPDSLPVLSDARQSTLQNLAESLKGAVLSLIGNQKDALAVATEWIQTWGKLKVKDSTAQSALEQRVTDSLQLLTGAEDTIGQVKSWAEWTRANLANMRPLPSDFFPLLSQRGAQYVNQWWSQVLSAQSKLEDSVVAIAQPIIGALATQYDKVAHLRDTLDNTFPACASADLIAPREDRTYGKIPTPGTPLTPLNDQLAYDYVTLSRFAKDHEALRSDFNYYRFLQQFLRDWTNANDTPHLIIQQIQKSLSLESARARLLSIVDFSRLREEIDQAIRQLIPHSSELSYAFAIALEKNAVQKASLGFCIPQEGCNLTIKSKTRIDFIARSTDFSSQGELGPFDIKLLGTIADAVTLKFDGVLFQSNGGPARCDVKFHSVVIGPMFKFLEQLQKFLSPKKGSGFYLVPLAEGVGIEAGYGLNLGTISFGNVSFSNVALNAAARLPFDSRQATFTAGLSRRDAPFMISIAPYGGAGFFLIEASSQGITAFEASFEYGGAAAFSYGPLNGFGRIMVGVYIRVGQQGKIAATFFAGGSASIWIFSFSASLYITAESKQGESAIVGTATFTFSFSIGFIDYDFHISAQKSVEWGDSKHQDTATLRRPTQPPGFAPEDSSELAVLSADTWCQSEHWGRHLEHFDLDLVQNVEEFV